MVAPSCTVGRRLQGITSQMVKAGVFKEGPEQLLITVGATKITVSQKETVISEVPMDLQDPGFSILRALEEAYIKVRPGNDFGVPKSYKTSEQ